MNRLPLKFTDIDALSPALSETLQRDAFLVGGWQLSDRLVRRLDARFVRNHDVDGRVPVLTYGPERLPQHLVTLMEGCEDRSTITALQVTIGGLDVVHAAQVTDDGEVGTTIVPGTAVIESWLLLLSVDQLLHVAERKQIGRRTDLVQLTRSTATDGERSYIAPLAFIAWTGPLLFADREPRRVMSVHALFSPFAGELDDDAAQRRVDQIVGLDVQWPLNAEDRKAVTSELIDLAPIDLWDANDLVNAGPALREAQLTAHMIKSPAQSAR